MRLCSWSIVLVAVVPLMACGGTPPSRPGAPPAGQAAGSKGPAAPPKAAASTASTAASAGSKAPSSPGTPAAGPESYAYQPDGRRDPFVNVLTTGSVDAHPTTTKRGEGPAGLAVNEISVRGVMFLGTKSVAQIQGPDGKSYNIRAGDKLLDGTITSINPQGLVIVQDVNDPLSTAKQREVRKLLRSLEDAK